MDRDRDTHALAWAAGFVDGEGHFGMGKSAHGGPTLFFHVGQSDPTGEISPLLTRLESALGIQAAYYRNNKRAAALHGWMPAWKLQITGFEKVQAVLAMLWPWLGEPKRQQGAATLAKFMQYRRTSTWVGYRTHCPAGHPYDEANTYRPPKAGSRMCRACRANKDRERKARRRLERQASLGTA